MTDPQVVYLLSDATGETAENIVNAVLTQFRVQQTKGQLRSIDRRVDLFRQVRESADMVLMTMREQDAPHLLAILDHVREVGQDQIDAEHVVIGEHETTVDKDDGVLVLEHHHVLADSPQSAKGYDFERCLSH